jgi:benzoate 4-monooxygenase
MTSIQDIMGHGNGFLKSDFYYAFDNIEQGIFTTRDRAKHARKRKFVAHMFSPKSMVEFEPYTTKALLTMGSQFESLLDTGKAGQYTVLGPQDEDIAARQGRNEVAIDGVAWAGFLAFDIIGDLVILPDYSRTLDIQLTEFRPLGNLSDSVKPVQMLYKGFGNYGIEESGVQQ